MEEFFKIGKIGNDLLIVLPKVSNFKISLVFKETIENEKNYENLILIMSDITYMDSSFIGSLVHISLKVKNEKAKVPIIYGNNYVEEIFKKYSLTNLFILKKDIIEFNEEILREVKSINDDEIKYLKSVLNDHKILSSLSEKNYETFKSLIESLEKEIEKRNNNGE
ncbi:MAG: STAS domain-containing protein [Spirochaetes bacterium]|nr:STAS domain-containing protein [Spirochaetota bacterium]